MMGPMMAEKPLNKDVPEIAIPMNSRWTPTHSTAAFVQMEAKPPLCATCIHSQLSGSRRWKNSTGTHQRAEDDSEEV